LFIVEYLRLQKLRLAFSQLPHARPRRAKPGEIQAIRPNSPGKKGPGLAVITHISD
jgi:hypothetical protein